jgi:hypothetical protein
VPWRVGRKQGQWFGGGDTEGVSGSMRGWRLRSRFQGHSVLDFEDDDDDVMKNINCEK